MTKLLVDSHNHVQHDAFDDDRDAVLDRALDRLAWMVAIGDTVAASEAAADLAARREGVYATAAIHPHHASVASDDELARIRAIGRRPKVVAIGEIGLDYHYDFSPRPVQRDALARQLQIAIEERLPVVIHCREAESDVIDIVGPVVPRLAGGVMHCFGGTVDFARQCLDWGFYVSFAGNVTFPKAENLRDAARLVPMDRLLVETDAPYLAPQPVRGKRCEPAHVLYTAEALAALKQTPPEDLIAATAANAAAFYGLSGKLG